MWHLLCCYREALLDNFNGFRTETEISNAKELKMMDKLEFLGSS